MISTRPKLNLKEDKAMKSLIKTYDKEPSSKQKQEVIEPVVPIKPFVVAEILIFPLAVRSPPAIIFAVVAMSPLITWSLSVTSITDPIDPSGGNDNRID